VKSNGKANECNDDLASMKSMKVTVIPTLGFELPGFEHMTLNYEQGRREGKGRRSTYRLPVTKAKMSVWRKQ